MYLYTRQGSTRLGQFFQLVTALNVFVLVTPSWLLLSILTLAVGASESLLVQVILTFISMAVSLTIKMAMPSLLYISKHSCNSKSLELYQNSNGYFLFEYHKKIPQGINSQDAVCLKLRNILRWYEMRKRRLIIKS